MLQKDLAGSWTSSNTEGEKLCYNHMNAASQLLRDKFPDVQGLSTPAVGECFKFDKLLVVRICRVTILPSVVYR